MKKSIAADQVLQNLHARDLLDLLPTGVQVIDRNGLVVYANDRHCESLGLGREDFVGKLHVWEILKSESEANNLKLYLEFLIKHQPKPTLWFGLHRRADGEGLPVKVDWDYIRNDANEVIGFISLVHPHPSW